jgi:4-hydroxy-tetrahydrodipicolinate reductase
VDDNRYRVAQWATGNVGSRCLSAIIDHPRLDLVGVRVYGEDKAGRDAGELCGRSPTGVIATRDIEDILAARPDCVVYAPFEADFDDVCRLLAAGINISTSRMEFNYRGRMAPDLLARIETACKQGGASLYATGSTPGFFTEIMPLALSALERRIDCITLTDFADMASRNSPEMLFRMLDFGKDPASLDPNAPVGTAMSSPPSLSMTAAALGLPLEDIVTSRDYAVAVRRTEVAAGTIEAGTVAAMRMEIAGLRAGKPVIRRRSTWYVTREIDKDWDLRDTGLHYLVEGDLPLDVMVTFPVSDDEFPKISPGMTAHPVVNAVPYVCAAAPGIRHTDELPLIVADLRPGDRG